MGLAMLVLPGVGLLTMFLGLAILAIEFAWARYWLKRLKETTGKAQQKVSGWFSDGGPIIAIGAAVP